jgi:uncharacterized protein YjbJ (UPF0337 family)
MLSAPALPRLTLLFVATLLIAVLLWAAVTATGTGGPLEGNRLWWPLLQVALVMGSFGAVVLVLSLLSPTIQAHIRREHQGARGEWRHSEVRSMQMAGKKIEGKIGQIKGKARAAVGKATGNKSAELKGRAQQAKGKLTEKLG